MRRWEMHIIGLAAVSALFVPAVARSEVDRDTALQTDLLIVGGTESGWAAAIQAARMGVQSILLVNDIDWIGGQFTAEAVGAIDENRGVDHKVPFPRSGLFRELTGRIEAFNQNKYGRRRPGNAWTARTTVRPVEAEAIFREMLRPYLKSGQLRIIEHAYPVAATLAADGRTLRSVRFRSTDADDAGAFTVEARITIDASDFGDVIQACGAKFEYGPDLKSRYQEPSAPRDRRDYPLTDMNPITWCLIIEQTDTESVIDRPPHYDERRYFLTTSATREDYQSLGWRHRPHRPFNPPWAASTGTFYQGERTVYSQRRLIDAEGLGIRDQFGDVILLCWSVQDYPLDVLPDHVAQRLEETEPGASRKNIVLLDREQRRIIFEDAKRHSLGMLYHLQTTVHERMADRSHTFRRFRLSREFGTPDHLPPKPYLRESLRLRAVYMMREQDTRFGTGPFARCMYPDGVFGWQFVYDFHPTGRAFLPGEEGGEAWEIRIKPGRSWGTISKRSLFPLRSLVPERVDALLGAQKNLGFSSIVSSAVRLHDQSIAVGQAAGAAAAVCLRHGIVPRRMLFDARRLSELRDGLCGRLEGHTPLVLWPYRDLSPDDECFVAANRLAVRCIFVGDPTSADFQPQRPLTRREAARVAARAALSAGLRRTYTFDQSGKRPAYDDVPPFDEDFAALESLVRWGFIPGGGDFRPDAPADSQFVRHLLECLCAGDEAARQRMHAALQRLSVSGQGEAKAVTRGKFAILVWSIVGPKPDGSWLAGESAFRAEADSDGDGIVDVNDALPFDRDNDSLPDLLDVDQDNDGLADGVSLHIASVRRFNFSGRGTPPAKGYADDHGEPFDEQRGFGWDRDRSADHRRRRVNADPTRDTFIFTRTTARWECMVPNGLYRVTVCLGDAAFDQPGQRIVVEGKSVGDDVTTSAGEFFERAVVVEVTDGRLTLDLGAEGRGRNTCLNRLSFEQIARPAAEPSSR